MPLIRSMSISFITTALLTIPTTSAVAEEIAITRSDIAADILNALKTDTLTQTALAAYFETNDTLLKSNINQGLNRYEKDAVSEVVAVNFDRYVESRDTILKNYAAFERAHEHIVKTIISSFSTDVPRIVLVPCIGLFSNNGWADTIDGIRYVFVALEMIAPPADIGVLLTHEIGHAVSDVGWDILLDGIYNEGYATWVSYELVPGKPLGTYLMKEPEQLTACYTWMNEHRQTIAEDIIKPLEVMNDMHRFYLTSSYSDYPNIGYVIGFEYIRYLRTTHSLEELRTFALDTEANRAAFDDFIRNAVFTDSTDLK